jgi:integrase
MTDTTTETPSATSRTKPHLYGDGSLYLRGRIWWIRYFVDGIERFESTRSPNEADARRLLDARRGDRARGLPIQPKLDRVRYIDAAQALRQHYQTTGCRDVTEAGWRLAHLDRFFTGRRLASIGPKDAEAYARRRQEAGASNASINRELAVLGRMLRLAYEQGQLARVPKLLRLTEAPPRSGFVDQETFEAIRQHLPEDLQAAVTIAFTFGWRRDEVLGLQRAQLDLPAGTLRLEPGSTKNDEGRCCYVTPELKRLLGEQLGRVRDLERRLGAVVPHLFPHLGPRFAGTPIRDFRKVWASACRKAGVPHLLKHDLRRSAVRILEQAAVPRSVAMKMTGHKTESVYRRYAIVSPADLKAAAARLHQYKAQDPDKHPDNRAAGIETLRVNG